MFSIPYYSTVSVTLCKVARQVLRPLGFTIEQSATMNDRRVPISGCCTIQQTSKNTMFLPLVSIIGHTTIISNAARTVLKQTFVNTSSEETLEEIKYVLMPKPILPPFNVQMRVIS
jgi:hypothetical protein